MVTGSQGLRERPNGKVFNTHHLPKAGPKTAWKCLNIDLQGKFRLVIAAGLIMVLVNIAVFAYEVSSMNKSISNLEIMEDLNNTILEMRRYEKNYLLYGKQDSLEQQVSFCDQAVEIFRHIPAYYSEGITRTDYKQLDKYLKQYRNILGELTKGIHNTLPDIATEKKFRSAGKALVDASSDLHKVEKRRMAGAAENAFRWPLFFMGFLLLLFIVGSSLVTKKVIKPLAELEKATAKIANGDFSPIPRTGRIQSQVDRLVAAFNRMAEELETRQEQVIHSRKIASLGTLVSGVAHELNNPINNIVLTIDTLTGGRKISEEKRAVLLNDILTQALRSSDIVKNLLDFSRAETSGLKDLNPALLLRQTVHLVENQLILAKVKFHDKIGDDLPLVLGNRQGLQQVFMNLIVNAIQAMSGGGDLTIQATSEDKREIRVVVSDTGSGIPARNLPHIFDPFFTTKQVGKGTGLGLSVSYGIIKKHGGKITVESKEGEGTVFTVILPASDQVVHG
jgi:two-component system NtrC family sensor kinase